MSEIKNCFTSVIFVTKFIGFFPVTEKNNKYTFCSYSFSTFYFFLSSFLTLTNFTLNIYDYKFGFLAHAVDVTGLIIELSLFLIAKHWSLLMKECDKTDFYMKNYGFPKYLKLKLQVVCIMMITTSVVTYFLLDIRLTHVPELFELYTLHGSFENAVRVIKQNASFATICEALFRISLRITHWQMSMLRCCTAVFIVTASTLLSLRLRQIVERLRILVKRQVQDQQSWMQIRVDYQRFYIFLAKWDDLLGYLILSSFASDVYMLLLQASSTIRVSKISLSNIIIILYPIEHLFRCMLVCYTAGNVYAEGDRLVQCLFFIPPNIFNTEIERIIVQIRQARPALTGKQFFTLKHSLILQIIGVILSHEIILLQYYKPRVIGE